MTRDSRACAIAAGVLRATRCGCESDCLIDRDSTIGQVQALVVEVGVEVALSSHHFQDAIVTPPGPMVRGKHEIRIEIRCLQCFVDVLRPPQRISNRLAKKRLGIVHGRDVVRSHQRRLALRKVRVPCRRCSRCRSNLMNHQNFVDTHRFNRLFDDVCWRDQAHCPR